MDPELRRVATDRRQLSEGAYKDQTNLVARQRLYDHQEPQFDLPGIVLDMLSGMRGPVLDLGCGNGRYLSRLRDERPDLAAVGADASLGMLEDVPAGLPVVCADAVELPVSAESVGAVLAMHMLYHVSDLDAALTEVIRVLTPDGVFIASTNAEDDKHELDELWASAAAEVMGVEQAPGRVRSSDNFPLDSGADVLREQFAAVEVHELKGHIETADPDVVLPHLASYRIWAAQSGVPFDDVLARVRERLERTVADAGAFTITTRNGVIRARRPE
ncbi:class I SAM-dependent methyltransferase [Streptomonospora litoralis]|uniref:Malonyl-[acyl-carrier protein] O-methyltransferase n=1 Tax=Streptomonospora litoralis TaxID=2498135 RepID=A0A4P6Q8F4_9ACTN|nr:methyltransferase domain-containing protein [Streptomonospora litoralis]QBI55771.1 Malonyl-[acyl-carrier protein] O-methyltransferase [Streptomonospora litoralis]